MDGGSITSQPITTLLLLAALSLLPFLFMSATSFVKISIVFSVVRNAIGLGQVPSGMVISALSLILSLYVMAPVGEEMWNIVGPRVASGQDESVATLIEVAREAKAPLVAFLERNARSKERTLFFDLARRARPEATRAQVGQHDLLVALPAFLVTELGEAFQIGFLVFLPFLILDLVVANVLMALGMHMLSPTNVSLPFKLLLFVAVDGWFVLSKALVLGYR